MDQWFLNIFQAGELAVYTGLGCLIGLMVLSLFAGRSTSGGSPISTDARSAWIPVLMRVIACLPGGVGLFILIWAIASLAISSASLKWEKTSGEIVAISTRTATVSGKTSHQSTDIPTLEYKYSASGRAYTGKRSLLETLSVTDKDKIAVYYNPQWPEQSILQPGVNTDYYTGIVIALAFMGGCAFPLWFWIPSLRARDSGTGSSETRNEARSKEVGLRALLYLALVLVTGLVMVFFLQSFYQTRTLHYLVESQPGQPAPEDPAYFEKRNSKLEQRMLVQLAHDEKQYGNSSPHLIDDLQKLAGHYSSLGEYEKARHVYGRLLSLVEPLLKAGQPGISHEQSAEFVLQTLSDLANTYEGLGDFVHAEALRRRAIAFAHKEFNQLQPSLITQSEDALTETLRNQKNYVHRSPSQIKAEKEADALLEEANKLNEQEKFVEAEPIYHRVLTIIEGIYGHNQKHVADRLVDVADNAYSQGKLEQAESAYKRALTVYKKAPGADDGEVAICLARLANNYVEKTEVNEAEDYFKQAIAIAQKPKASQQPWMKWVYQDYARLLRKSNRGPEAMELEKLARSVPSE